MYTCVTSDGTGDYVVAGTTTSEVVVADMQALLFRDCLQMGTAAVKSVVSIDGGQVSNIIFPLN